ncbi:hypothetical protein [Streptomyces atratus]|uniref:hypothetical protein n=1 Tax=Streptomyces atratus TaxID=1893 RepID=UPI0037921C98
MRVTVVREGAEAQDALIAVDENATAAEVAEAIGRLAQRQAFPRIPGAGGSVISLPSHAAASEKSSGGPALWVDGWRCDPAAPVGTVLRDGARLCTDDSIGTFMSSGEPTGRYEVRVCGGPGAGRVARLPIGHSTLGSASTSTLMVDDHELPASAVGVTIDIKGRVEIAPQQGAEVSLDDEPWSARASG